jgi:cytochrome c
VARKYKGDPKAVDYLVKKVINGGAGVWGNVAMAAHPQLPVKDATEIVKYILNVGNEEIVKSYPTKGSYESQVRKDAGDKGVLILRAAYTDKGANGIQPATSEKVLMLKSANFPASTADKIDGVMKFKLDNPPMELMIGSSNNAYLAFNRIDMTGIGEATCLVFATEDRLGAAGGTIEVRIDSPQGELIGESRQIAVVKGKNPPMTPAVTPIKLKTVNGFHDVYFIYKNDKAPAGQPLFIITNIQLRPDVKALNALTMN